MLGQVAADKYKAIEYWIIRFQSLGCDMARRTPFQK